MKNCIAYIIAVALSLINGFASAETLNITKEGPRFYVNTAIIEFIEFGEDFDISSAGSIIDASFGVSLDGSSELGLGVAYLSSAPETSFSGGFDVLDAAGLFLSGELFEIGFANNELELLFGRLSGRMAGLFGDEVLMQIRFIDEVGADPFSAFSDGLSLTASIHVSKVAPDSTTTIPLIGSQYFLVTAFINFFGLKFLWQPRRSSARYERMGRLLAQLSCLAHPYRPGGRTS